MKISIYPSLKTINRAMVLRSYVYVCRACASDGHMIRLVELKIMLIRGIAFQNLNLPYSFKSILDRDKITSAIVWP